MKEKEDINTEQPTYNALGRSAMFFGVPILALAVCGFVGVLGTLLAMPFLEGRALFILLLPIPFILFLRTISATDDSAFRIVSLELKWFLRKANGKLFNGTNTVLATKYGRQRSDYQRFFEQGPEGAASSIRLSAENLPTRHK
ncbi:MAG: VirB3 family type IV secretion system protein [Neisseria sp.]